jgi:hypothetical protein
MLTVCRLRAPRIPRMKRTPLRVSRSFVGFVVVHRSDCEIDTSIEAPPSLLPARKYCDITGLEVCILSARTFDSLSEVSRHTTPILQLGCVITTRTYIS